MPATHRKLLAANWKMHLSLQEAQELTSEVVQTYQTEIAAPLPLVLCVPFPYLSHVLHLTKGEPFVAVGAQNVHHKAEGAYTGEVSAQMLRSVGTQYAVVGHSERRQYFGETPQQIADKIALLLEHRIRPIFCLGETLEEREAGQTIAVLTTQLEGSLAGFTAEQMAQIVVAYEPVWAIGTGRTASPEQAQEVHAALRAQLTAHFGDDVAQATPILYGGSLKADNAAGLFAQPDIDGGLVGGASLHTRSFIIIAKALATYAH